MRGGERRKKIGLKGVLINFAKIPSGEDYDG